MSWADAALPISATVLTWFVATGFVAWLDNRNTRTFRTSLIIAAVIGVAGLGLIIWSAHSVGVASAYAGFFGALMVWAWHEIAFLLGAVTGPRKMAMTTGQTGWTRFVQATGTVIHHEIALLLTAVLLLAISWPADNQIGASVFALLFTLRLSSKMNIYAGVPNMSAEILPPHLGYLKSYFGRPRLTVLLPLSIMLIAAGVYWLASLAIAAPSGSSAQTQGVLLATLAALGLLEHVFMALPFRDSGLWRWAMPRSNRQVDW